MCVFWVGEEAYSLKLYENDKHQYDADWVLHSSVQELRNYERIYTLQQPTVSNHMPLLTRKLITSNGGSMPANITIWILIQVVWDSTYKLVLHSQASCFYNNMTQFTRLGLHSIQRNQLLHESSKSVSCSHSLANSLWMLSQALD